ncbi:unnamed protein product [Acanthoscelides obtectus]|uniref:Uncharacterized protein n=1 Tax=Acanthoscelides obtectus TaxID=200917 RepID=A0A9P0KVF8_ACAOB|nr:unnamed protein product [Acanthoscelides obtectus]CAK1635867.1 hypothetical protein AOBTE_LOCUS9577 [Acanthoscelides obtectus]
MAGNEAGHGAIVRNRDLIDVWIEAPRGNRWFMKRYDLLLI